MSKKILIRKGSISAPLKPYESTNPLRSEEGLLPFELDNIFS
jgi:hypothetical protein